MTKKEYHQNINKQFYDFVNKNFPKYDIDSSEGYGLIYLIDREDRKQMIEYHQSRHDLCILNSSDRELNNDMKIMEQWLHDNCNKLWLEYCNKTNKLCL